MSEDSAQSGTGQLCQLEDEGSGSPCASPSPSLTLPASTALPTTTTPFISTDPATPCSEHSAAASSTSARSDIGEPPRPRLTASELESISLPDLVQHWKELDVYTEWLDNQAANQEVEIANLSSFVERAKQQHLESLAKERVVLRRLATKEQEIQELMAQITDLKASASPSAGSLRSAFLDPAVNLLLQKLRSELTTARAQLEETQNELNAWKFTPDSNTGKRLMAKCRQLYQENEELGKLVASGRMAKLEGELALQKSFSLEVKKSQSELDEFLQELDEDVEGMQSTVYYLQQELRKSRELISSLEHKLNKYRKGRGKGKSKRQLTNEDGEQMEEEGKDEEEQEAESDEDSEMEDLEEEKGDWKELTECDVETGGDREVGEGDVEGGEGESWEEWRENDEREEDWNHWGEDEDEVAEAELNEYPEEDNFKDWSEDHKENMGADSNQDFAPSDEEESSQNGSTNLKRTKTSDDVVDKSEAPLPKKLKPFFPESESDKDSTIVEGPNENSNKNSLSNV